MVSRVLSRKRLSSIRDASLGAVAARENDVECWVFVRCREWRKGERVEFRVNERSLTLLLAIGELFESVTLRV